jgi:hypothetical protein
MGKSIRQSKPKKPPPGLPFYRHATVNMRAAVLLACNGALGNTDLALLPVKASTCRTGPRGFDPDARGLLRTISGVFHHTLFGASGYSKKPDLIDQRVMAMEDRR